MATPPRPPKAPLAVLAPAIGSIREEEGEGQGTPKGPVRFYSYFFPPFFC